MPYTAEHSRAVRRRIVRSARDLLNRKGYANVSIDEVMAGAGLTAAIPDCGPPIPR